MTILTLMVLSQFGWILEPLFGGGHGAKFEDAKLRTYLGIGA